MTSPAGQYLRGVGWRLFVFVAIAGLVAWLSPLGSDDGAPAPAAIEVAGEAETVFDWSEEACGPANIPDLPARALVDQDGTTRLLLSHYESRWMTGPDLGHLRVDCRIALPSGEDHRPERFNDREWLASLWSIDGRSVTALVHDEYQGHLHPGRCPEGEYLPCWYNAITIAHSGDGGRSFTQPPAPSSLVAASPRPYEPGVGPSGALSPSNIVEGPGDGYVYALYNAREPGGQSSTCLMRTPTPDEAGSWRSWDGSEFSIPPVDPFAASPSPTPCAAVALGEISAMRESLTYNTHLGRYLLVGMAAAPDPEDRDRLVTGVYYSVSEDLLSWTPRTLLMEAQTTQRFRCGGPDPVAYPSIIDPRSDSRVFATSGERPYLYFTKFNYAGCEMTADRDLVRVPLRVSEAA